MWIQLLAAMVGAVLTGRAAWNRLGSVTPGLLTCVGIGSVTAGAIGFTAGFFGPMILAPDANQGPLLGIFITGPLGFLLGGVGGGLYWLLRKKVTPADMRSA
jgi:hypothetical protein